MKRAVAAVMLAGSLLGFAGCSNSTKGEAASLVAAVDRFRRADFAGKPALLGPLQAVECTDKEVCAAKSACVAHAEPLVESIRTKNEVDLRMQNADAEPLDPEARGALIRKLDQASRLLDKGRTAQGACDEKILQLRVKYGV